MDTPTPPPTSGASSTPPPDEAELKRALAAFKKRFKLSQLEEDSKLGHSPMTGKRNTLTAIKPPLGFGRAVWQALADRGELKDDGGGFYQLPKKP